MTRKVTKDGKQMATRLKFFFDMLFLAAVVLFVIKIGVLLLNKAASLDIALPGGTFLWNFGPLMAAAVAVVGSKILKDRDKFTG